MTDTFFVSYRLREHSDRYEQLYEAIKATAVDEKYIHPFDNVWIVNSDEDARSISDALARTLDDDDTLLVVRFSTLELEASYGGRNLGDADAVLSKKREHSWGVDISAELRKKLFVVSCDLEEKSTDRIAEALERRADTCVRVATSTWVLRSTIGIVDLLAELRGLIGTQNRAFVAQVSNGTGKAPFGFLMGAVTPSEAKDCADMQRSATLLREF